jgi:SAM-dependent methyltransferase
VEFGNTSERTPSSRRKFVTLYKYPKKEKANITTKQWGCGMILDVGCGNSPKGDVNCDLYRKNTPHLMGDTRIQNTKIPNFVLCDATHLPFKDKVFEKAYASQVLEHILHPALLIEEMKRVATRMVTFDVPNLRRLTPEENPFHIYSWSDRTLANLLKRYFRDVTIVGAEYDSYIPQFLLKKRYIEHVLRFAESALEWLFGKPFLKAVCRI